MRDGGRLKLWIGKRADNRPIEPGKLDHLVAGGIPLGMSVMECLTKECEEEASIPAALAARARPAGAIRYRMEHQGWLRNDTMFVYDLELPADFKPVNNDGEIASFRLMELDEVEEILAAGEDFKFNVALVLIDFLIRHGHIAPEHPRLQRPRARPVAARDGVGLHRVRLGLLAAARQIDLGRRLPSSRARSCRRRPTG